jgi:TRAP-type C4-dicarboxylate transport system permease small subunit
MFERVALAIGDKASALFLVGFVISAYEVLARYAFGAPTTWVHATTTTLCGVAFALGGATVMARGEHIRVTVLIDRGSPGLRRTAELLSLLCGLVYLGGLGWAAAQEAAQSVWRFESGHWAPEPLPGPPGWPLPALLRVMLAVGTLLFLGVVLQQLWRWWRKRAAA